MNTYYPIHILVAVPCPPSIRDRFSTQFGSQCHFTFINSSQTIPESLLRHTDVIIGEPDEPDLLKAPRLKWLQPNQEFMVEYSFDYHINYVELDPKRVAGEQPDFCLEEQSPHIMFTPYLRELRDELAGDEMNPVILARRFYDFVTTKVMYSFVREYFTIECIPEYCAVNLKGDCGVQALLFITLCRMSGIPARWQSGLYATDYYTGCHDWVQFYVAPYGWVFADLSFGGSAWRAGEIERWNYYFGNLDVFRMPANSEIQKAFVPEKKWLRIDPIDNQRGEFEYEDHGLRFSQVEVSQKLISMEDIEK